VKRRLQPPSLPFVALFAIAQYVILLVLLHVITHTAWHDGAVIAAGPGLATVLLGVISRISHALDRRGRSPHPADRSHHLNRKGMPNHRQMTAGLIEHQR
jgi:hypothetical protein